MGNTYLRHRRQLEQQVKDLKQKSAWYSVTRFVLMGLIAFLVYQALNGDFWLWPLLVFLGLAVFLVLVKKHDALKQALALRRAQVEETEQEQAYLEGVLPQRYGAGQGFINPQHNFSNDLDVFGEQSLYHHLNRTFTQRGQEKLARYLAQQEKPADLMAQQKAHKELSQMPEWCLQFRAYGALGEDDPLLEKKLSHWLQRQSRPGFLTHPFLLIPFASVCILLLLHWLWQPTAPHFYWFLYAFLGNVGITFLSARKITEQYKALNNLSKPLFGISRLLAHLENQAFKNAYWQKLLAPIQNAKSAPSKSLRRLGKIVNAFDQLNNPVALFFLNGLMHYHLHSLRKLQKWKTQNQTQVGQWLQILAEAEAQVSLATYAANHPNFNYPQFLEQPGFKADEMGHPLLSEKKAVCNCMQVESWRYAILTGSNMSGKSTFLKTVGLNLLLSQLGLPVFAKRLEVYPFRLFTSMKLVDSISKEESYFQAEVLRLKHIKEALQKGDYAFLLLDEILRGTNSEDKKHGTRLFMEQLSKIPHFGILATHDVDITDLSQEQPQVFTNLYFESKVENGELLFDYQLRPGVCTTPNATDLMKSYGII
jgi:hypothetical protein